MSTTAPTGQVDPGTRPAGEPPDAPASPAAVRRLLDAATRANTVTVTVLAIVLALVIGAILIVVSKTGLLGEYGYFFAAPGQVLGDTWAVVANAYGNLFKGALFDPQAVSAAAGGTGTWSAAFYPLSETLTYAAPLVFTGLAVALAFRGGLFNIGAQGQAVVGGIAGGLVGFGLHLPPVLHVLVALLGAALGGGLLGGLVGALKARTGAHEVIVTIMLNYIALSFLTWLIKQPGVHDPNRTDAISKPVDANAALPSLGGANLRWNLGIALGVLAAIAVTWLLARSTTGFELRAVGANPDAARTAGMSVGRTYVVVMMLSGALAGLGGGTVLLGTAHTLTSQYAGNIGFDGITVALLGRGRPVGVVVSALLFGALYAGGNQMQQASGVAIDLVTVVQAIIVIFIAAPALVKEIFRLRGGASGVAGTLAKGW